MTLRSRIRMAAVATASALAAACTADKAASSSPPASSARFAEARPTADSATVVHAVQFHVAQFSGYLLSTGRQ
jgi:hypothetical protein